MLCSEWLAFSAQDETSSVSVPAPPATSATRPAKDLRAGPAGSARAIYRRNHGAGDRAPLQGRRPARHRGERRRAPVRRCRRLPGGRVSGERQEEPLKLRPVGVTGLAGVERALLQAGRDDLEAGPVECPGGRGELVGNPFPIVANVGAIDSGHLYGRDAYELALRNGGLIFEGSVGFFLFFNAGDAINRMSV